MEKKGRSQRWWWRRKGPTKKEKEEHEATRIPFRSWCRYCVRGRGRNKPHRGTDQSEEEEMRVATITMDYFFMNEEDAAAKEYPCLVTVDEETGEKSARATGRKGVG